MTRFSSKSGGFTLLEALLAIVLMGIILGLAYGGFHNAFKTTQRGEELIQRAQAVRTANQFIRRQVGRMLPLAYVNDGRDVIVFEGDSDSVTFVAPMPGYLGFGGTQVQQLELARADDGYDLLFRHSVLSGYEDGSLGDQEPVLLLEGIEDGSFEFLLAALEENEEPSWETSWEEPAQLPLAIAVDLKLKNASRTAWPELVAVRKTDAGGGSTGSGALQQQIQQLINQRRAERNRAGSGSN